MIPNQKIASHSFSVRSRRWVGTQALPDGENGSSRFQPYIFWLENERSTGAWPGKSTTGIFWETKPGKLGAPWWNPSAGIKYPERPEWSLLPVSRRWLQKSQGELCPLFNAFFNTVGTFKTKWRGTMNAKKSMAISHDCPVIMYPTFTHYFPWLIINNNWERWKMEAPVFYVIYQYLSYESYDRSCNVGFYRISRNAIKLDLYSTHFWIYCWACMFPLTMRLRFVLWLWGLDLGLGQPPVP